MMLETERLILREWVREDAQSLFELNSDKQVIQFTGDVAFNDIAEAESLIVNYRQYDSPGFGRLAVVLKSTEQNIGWCGLKKHETGWTDIGFRLLRSEWNKGYATEAAKRVLELAFNSLHLHEVIAHAMIENIGSQKVLEKIGMKISGYGQENGNDVVQYKLTAADFSDIQKRPA